MLREWRMKRLRKQVQSSNPQVQLRAAARLFGMGDEAAYGILVRALEDEKLCPPAALAFKEAGRLTEVIPQVEKMLLSTSSTWTAMALAVNLIHAGEPAALPVLAAFISKRKSNEFPWEGRPTPTFEFIAFGINGEDIFTQVINALGQKGDRGVVLALEVALKDPSAKVSKAAETALLDLKSRLFSSRPL